MATMMISNNNSNNANTGIVRYGTGTDPDSYAGDVPRWEPTPDAVYTADGRRIDSHKVLRRSDTGAVLSVVGEGMGPVAWDYLSAMVGA